MAMTLEQWFALKPHNWCLPLMSDMLQYPKQVKKVMVDVYYCLLNGHGVWDFGADGDLSHRIVKHLECLRIIKLRKLTKIDCKKYRRLIGNDDPLQPFDGNLYHIDFRGNSTIDVVWQLLLQKIEQNRIHKWKGW